jgi:hypothetical protein
VRRSYGCVAGHRRGPFHECAELDEHIDAEHAQPTVRIKGGWRWRLYDHCDDRADDAVNKAGHPVSPPPTVRRNETQWCATCYLPGSKGARPLDRLERDPALRWRGTNASTWLCDDCRTARPNIDWRASWAHEVIDVDVASSGSAYVEHDMEHFRVRTMWPDFAPDRFETEIAERIVALCQAGFRQADIARTVGVTQGQVSKTLKHWRRNRPDEYKAAKVSKRIFQNTTIDVGDEMNSRASFSGSITPRPLPKTRLVFRPTVFVEARERLPVPKNVAVAKLAGISRSYIQLVIAGAIPSPPIRERIAGVLGVGVNDLWREVEESAE